MAQGRKFDGCSSSLVFALLLVAGFGFRFRADPHVHINLNRVPFCTGRVLFVQNVRPFAIGADDGCHKGTRAGASTCWKVAAAGMHRCSVRGLFHVLNGSLMLAQRRSGVILGNRTEARYGQRMRTEHAF